MHAVCSDGCAAGSLLYHQTSSAAACEGLAAHTHKCEMCRSNMCMHAVCSNGCAAGSLPHHQTSGAAACEGLAAHTHKCEVCRSNVCVCMSVDLMVARPAPCRTIKPPAPLPVRG
jgi:hypothetical protein